MVKVAVIGQVNGQFRAAFEKLNALQAKQSFSLALFLGSLFSDPTDPARDSAAAEAEEADIALLLAGKIRLDVPSYFSVGAHPLPPAVRDKIGTADGELCPNLLFLGRRGNMRTAEGIRIVALGGRFNNRASAEDECAPVYTAKDVASLARDVTVDILLTSDWPAQVLRGSQKKLPDGAAPPRYSEQVSFLCSRTRPRYLFSSSPRVFFEREPFFHPPRPDPTGPTVELTRFLGLAAFGNAEKQKWIYAFNIDPSPPVLVAPPAGAGPSPLPSGDRDGAGGAAYSRFAADDSQSGGRHGRNKRQKGPKPIPRPEDCFFCLANPNIATHLITTIGEDAYLTTAKGPLPSPDMFAEEHGIDFPCHMLIIPLAHAPQISLIEEKESQAATIREMDRFRTVTQTMLSDKSKGRLGVVTWEISRPTGVHLHWQLMPVPVELVRRGLVEAAFKVEAENRRYPTFEVSGREESVDADEPEFPFFRVRIWAPPGGEEEKGGDQTLTMELDPTAYFDLQFGRHVLAQLLGLNDRKQWKDCVQDEKAESDDAERFKKAFEKYDFTE